MLMLNSTIHQFRHQLMQKLLQQLTYINLLKSQQLKDLMIVKYIQINFET